MDGDQAMRRLPSLLLIVASSIALAQDTAPEATPEMTLRQMQILLHHAVEIAAEGAGLVALGQMQTAPEMDAVSIARGRDLIAEARALIVEVAAGDSMVRLHGMQLSEASNARMIATHALELAASNYVTAVETSLAAE